jgi:hypothetical protein
MLKGILASIFIAVCIALATVYAVSLLDPTQPQEQGLAALGAGPAVLGSYLVKAVIVVILVPVLAAFIYHRFFEND